MVPCLGRSEIPPSTPEHQGGDVVKFSDDGQMPGCPGGGGRSSACFIRLT